MTTERNLPHGDGSREDQPLPPIEFLDQAAALVGLQTWDALGYSRPPSTQARIIRLARTLAENAALRAKLAATEGKLAALEPNSVDPVRELLAVFNDRRGFTTWAERYREGELIEVVEDFRQSLAEQGWIQRVEISAADVDREATSLPSYAKATLICHGIRMAGGVVK